MEQMYLKCAVYTALQRIMRWKNYKSLTMRLNLLNLYFPGFKVFTTGKAQFHLNHTNFAR